MYGLDVILTNGKKYFEENKIAKGHPFWGGDQSFPADLIISGRVFKNQQLKYNLHKQEFILVYSDYNNQPTQIILHTPLIDSVATNNGLFIQNHFPEIKQPFVSVVHQGNVSCCVGIGKDLLFSRMGVNTGYSYSKEYQKYYLILKGTAHQFSNKSSFIRIFPKNNRPAIRKYISMHRIKFGKMNEHMLKPLIAFCAETIK